MGPCNSSMSGATVLNSSMSGATVLNVDINALAMLAAGGTEVT